MIWIICLFLTQATLNEDTQAIWQKGNQAYSEGLYEEATSHYDRLLEQGIQSGQLHYNLGNAHYKQGHIGQAVLHFAKARKFLPSDPDVIANLELAESQRKDPPIEGEAEAFADAFDSVARSFSYELLFNGSLIFIILAGLASMGLILRPNTGKWLGYVLVISGVLGIFIGGLAFLQHKQLSRNDMAVLLDAVVEVYPEPNTLEKSELKLHEGLRCRIVDEEEGWYRIGLANGYSGWVPRTSLARI